MSSPCCWEPAEPCWAEDKSLTLPQLHLQWAMQFLNCVFPPSEVQQMQGALGVLHNTSTGDETSCPNPLGPKIGLREK